MFNCKSLFSSRVFIVSLLNLYLALAFNPPASSWGQETKTTLTNITRYTTSKEVLSARPSLRNREAILTLERFFPPSNLWVPELEIIGIGPDYYYINHPPYITFIDFFTRLKLVLNRKNGSLSCLSLFSDPFLLRLEAALGSDIDAKNQLPKMAKEDVDKIEPDTLETFWIETKTSTRLPDQARPPISKSDGVNDGTTFRFHGRDIVTVELYEKTIDQQLLATVGVVSHRVV